MLTACDRQTVRHYNEDSVAIKKVAKMATGRVKVYYTTMSETLYYCPGVNILEKADSVNIHFIRCSLKDKCKVSHPGAKDSGGEFVVINNGLKPIFFGTKRLIFPGPGLSAPASP